MNLEEALRIIQELRGQLGVWGVTNQGLWIAGVVGLVLFLVSLREVLSWYLRVYKVRDEVRALRVQIADLQKVLTETRDILVSTGVVSEKELASSPTTAAAEGKVKLTKSVINKFRLDH